MAIALAMFCSDGLAGLRRGHDQATLALADRRHDVDEAAGELVRRGLLLQAFLRIQRGELAELRTMLRFLDAHAVDGVDGLQRHELLTLVATFAFTRGADGAVHGVALAQAVLLDLAHGDIHVVRSRQVAGRTHERVGVEHVDDAGDRHEVFLRLVAMLVAVGAIHTIVALVAVGVAVHAVGAIVTVVAIIAIAPAATLVTLVVIAVTDTHTAATAIVASTAVTVFVVFGLVATLIIVGVFLRRQRGEDVIKVAHDVFALRPVRHATAATRLEIVPTVVITTATAVILLWSGIVKAQFCEQVGAGFGVTMATTLRRFIVRLQRVHRCHGIRDFGGFRGLGLLGTDGAFLLLGFIGLLVLCRFDLSVYGGSGLWRAHGDAGRSLAAGTGGLKCCDQFGLAHGGDTTKSHLLGELLELGQFHIIEIRACCHW